MSSLLNLLENTKFGNLAVSEFNNEGIMPTAYHNGEYADFGSNRGFDFPAGCFGHRSFNNCVSHRSFNSCVSHRSYDDSCDSYRSYNNSDFGYCDTYNDTYRTFNGHNDFTPLSSLSYQTKVTWSDIQTIYNNLNNTRKKYGIATVAVPNLTSTMAQNEAITSLKDLISAMSSSSNVGTNASTSAIAVPADGTKISTSIFTDLNNIIVKAEQNCIGFTGTN